MDIFSKSEDVRLEAGWKKLLNSEFEKPYFKDIIHFIKSEKEKGKIIYPPGPMIFHAFNMTPLKNVKVVILGQDPYHGPKEAMGLCFSVPKGIKVPPSLQNIYKEMNNDIDFDIPSHGDLTSWAKQGVFMLNAILTVEHKKAGSHSGIGWQTFTDAVISKLSAYHNGLVFMLWGNFAKSKKYLIDELKHHVLESVHPSPFTGNAFFGNYHFSTANQLLISEQKTPIDWTINQDVIID